MFVLKISGNLKNHDDSCHICNKLHGFLHNVLLNYVILEFGSVV